MYKLSSYTDYKQLFLLIATVFINFGIWIAYKLSGNINYYYIWIGSFTIFSIINIIYSMLYDISIENQELYVKNLYNRQIRFKKSDFEKIQVANDFHLRFFIPYFFMSPPYYVLRIVGGKTYIFLDKNPESMLSLFNASDYSTRLTNKVKELLEG